MKYAFVVALTLFAVGSASAMTAATEQFLSEKVKVDPKSADIQAIANDVVVLEDGSEVSLDTLAVDGDRGATLKFIATRKFVKAYMKNTKTPFPDRKVYETMYLTEDEVTFILSTLKKPFTAVA